jgi:hypothetical protein
MKQKSEISETSDAKILCLPPDIKYRRSSIIGNQRRIEMHNRGLPVGESQAFEKFVVCSFASSTQQNAAGHPQATLNARLTIPNVSRSPHL